MPRPVVSIASSGFTERPVWRTPLALLCLLLALGGGGAPEAGAAEAPEGTTEGQAGASYRALSVAEVDRQIEQLFARQKELKRIQAEVTVTKSGGPFRRSATTFGRLRAEVPNRLLYVDRGTSAATLPPEDCTIVLVDGAYLWEIEPVYEDEPREAERRALDEAIREGRGMDLVSFFVGREVETPSDLRESFVIEGYRAGAGEEGSYRFDLRREGEGADDALTLWIRPGEALPWKVRSVETGAAGSRPRVRLQVLSEVRTNRTGLSPFPPETFVPPLKKGMIVFDETGREIPWPELEAFLKARRDSRPGAAGATARKDEE